MRVAYPPVIGNYGKSKPDTGRMSGRQQPGNGGWRDKGRYKSKHYGRITAPSGEVLSLPPEQTNKHYEASQPDKGRVRR